MSDRIFLDTNIFAYSFDLKDRAKAGIATNLIKQGLAEHNAWISYQVIQEFFNVAQKKFAVPMPVEHCQKYLTTVFRSLKVIHSSLNLFSEAAEIRSRYQLSWYDSLIVGAASEAACTVLYSEDLQHGAKVSGVRIVNPFRQLA